MRLKIVFYFIVFLGIVSCRNKSEIIYSSTYDFTASVYDQPSWQLRNTDTLTFEKKSEKYLYKKDNQINEVSTIGDSTIIYLEEECTLIKQKEYNVGRKKVSFLVKTFLYNTEGVDEEIIILFSPSKGILVEKSLWWPSIMLNHSISNHQLLETVMNDSTSLSFPDNFLPKPPIAPPMKNR